MLAKANSGPEARVVGKRSHTAAASFKKKKLHSMHSRSGAKSKGYKFAGAMMDASSSFHYEVKSMKTVFRALQTAFLPQRLGNPRQAGN